MLESKGLGPFIFYIFMMNSVSSLQNDYTKYLVVVFFFLRIFYFMNFLEP